MKWKKKSYINKYITKENEKDTYLWIGKGTSLKNAIFRKKRYV